MVKKTFRTKPPWHADAEKIAKERIEILFAQAEKEFEGGRLDLAKRYVELARKIGMKTNVPIPTRFKRKFCKKCHNYLAPGKSSRVSVDSKRRIIIVACLSCGAVSHYPFSKKGGSPGAEGS